MLLLAAAATDQTGRTITMLSAGLVAVALGLTALTIWYWRFTSPRRRATAAASVTVHRPVAEEPASAEVPLVVASPAESAEPSDPVEPSEWVELWAAGDPPDEPEPIDSPDPVMPPPHTDHPPIGLDSEQWAVLSQAVLDEYLDS